MQKYKVAILISHVIQYQSPLYRELSKTPDIDCMVYYCWDFGLRTGKKDVHFGQTLQWDIPLLDGYQYTFLKNYSFSPNNSIFGLINFGIVYELATHRYDALMLYGWNSITNWLAYFTALFWGYQFFFWQIMQEIKNIGKIH